MANIHFLHTLLGQHPPIFKKMSSRKITLALPLAVLCFSVVHSAPVSRAFTERSTHFADFAAVQGFDTSSRDSEEMSAKTTNLLEKEKTNGSFSGSLFPREVPAGFYRRRLRKRDDCDFRPDEEPPFSPVVLKGTTNEENLCGIFCKDCIKKWWKAQIELKLLERFQDPSCPSAAFMRLRKIWP
jgi:hypothetical protein